MTVTDVNTSEDVVNKAVNVVNNTLNFFIYKAEEKTIFFSASRSPTPCLRWPWSQAERAARWQTGLTINI